MEKILERLKEQLNFSVEETPYLNAKKYAFGPIDKQNFFNSEEKKEKTLFFIDGGHQEIIGSNTFSISYNKLCAARFLSNMKQEIILIRFWTSSILKKDGESLRYIVESYSDDGFSICFEIDAYDPSLSENKNRISPSRISSLARKMSEVIFAKQISEKNKDCILVLDGIMLGNSDNDINEFNRLYESAIKNNNIICSLAKTSNLVTNTGKSLSLAIDNISREKTWNYKVAESLTDSHNAAIMLLKLHERSDHIFRFEMMREHKEKAGEIIGLLKDNSRDSVFLGYPYGLIVADEMARVSNNETEYLKTMLLSKAGKDAKKIHSLIKDSDAHSILDNIKF